MPEAVEEITLNSQIEQDRFTYMEKRLVVVKGKNGVGDGLGVWA